MQICVTGGNGLVGTALRNAVAGNEKIAGRFMVRRPEPGSPDTLSPDLRVAMPADWIPAIGESDVVVHLAAALPWSGEDAEGLQRINVDAAVSLARAAAECGVSRFVFVSTLGVHGITSGDTPFTSRSAIAPSGPYAASKYKAEQALAAFCLKAGMELVVLRPPVVYGPGISGKIGALSDMIRKGGRLPLGRIEGNRRQMIGTDNLADAILIACTHEQASAQPLLPADSEAVSTYEFLRILADAHGTKLRILPVPEGLFRLMRPLPVLGGFAERLIGNVEVRDDTLGRVIGWSAARTLTEGVRRMVDSTASEHTA